MQATLPLTEYLNNHNIPWFPINISFGPERTEKYPMGKKHLEPYQETNYKPSTNDFQNLTQEDIHRRQAYPYKHIAMDTSRVGHVDVDEAWADDEAARQEYPHYLSASKNMPHFFTFYDRAEGDPRKSVLNGKVDGKDYLSGSWGWAPRYGDVINPDAPIPRMVFPNPKGEQEYREYNTDYSGIEIKEILDGIKPDCPYDAWLKIGMALKISGFKFEDWDNWSRGADNYNHREMQAKWDTFEYPPEEGEQAVGKVSFGTIMHYLKHYAPEKAKEIAPKLVNKDERIFIEDIEGNEYRTLTNKSVAELFYNQFKEKYVFDTDWYMFDDRSGIMKMLDKRMVEAYMLKDSMTYITNLLNKIINITKNEDKRNKLVKIKNKTESSSFMKASFPFMETRFADPEFKAKLDTIQHTFGFKNGVWDMEMQKFRKGEKSDCISKYVNFDWEDTCDHDFFDKLIWGWFENTEMADWFKKHLGSLFVGGNPEEHFYFYDGLGRNGKGTVDTLLKSIMGKFYTILDVSYFTTYKRNDGAPEPHLLKMENTKCVMINELGESTKLITKKVNQISGNDAIPARLLYSNDVKNIDCSFKCIIQTNHLPVFTDINDGLLNRICPIHFPFKFMSEDEFEPENTQHRRANIQLKGVCKDKKVEFFNYIMAVCVPGYKKDGITPLPQMVKKNINKYRSQIDDVGAFALTELREKPFLSQVKPITTNLMYNQYQAWREQVMETEEITSRDKFSKRLKTILGEGAYKRALVDQKKQSCIVGWEFVNEYEYTPKTNNNNNNSNMYGFH